jgi:hypothetical protein
LKIKKPFPTFYCPWAEFLPTGPAEPAPTSLTHGPAPVVPYPTPDRHRVESAVTDRNLNEPGRNRILVELESLEVEPYTSVFRRKLKQTLGSPLSSPCHVRRSLSSINTTLVFYISCRTRLTQPCREPTLGALPHRRRRLNLETCRRTSYFGAPRR